MIALMSKSQTLQAVAQVDLKKYVGKWYEIASYPQRFQKDATAQLRNIHGMKKATSQ